MSRIKNLFRNSVIGMLSFVLSTVATFILQRYFVRILGYSIQGLNAVFTNIINTLSIVELGIGMAIVFSLYKPLADKDEKKIALLIGLYRKIYLIIGVVVVAMGLAAIPLLTVLTKHEFSLGYLIPIHLLFLANSFLSYLFTYNHTLLSADQKQYMVSLTTVGIKTVAAAIQLCVLILTKNFYLYLSVNIVVNAIFNVFLTLYVRKQYPYIKKTVGSLSKEETAPIKENVWALMFHRVGNYLVAGVGGLVISALLGTTVAGYYSNYVYLSTALISLITSIFAGITATFGNMVVKESQEVILSNFKRARFINFVFYAIAAAGAFVLINDILTVWLDGETVLDFTFLLLFVLNFFITGYSAMLGNLRAAAGVFKPDKYLHIIIAVINIGMSFAFVTLIGAAGALLGITISLFIKELTILPLIGKKYIYGGKARDYYLSFILDFFVALTAVVLCWFTYSKFGGINIYLKIFAGAAVCIAIPAAIIFITYFKTDEFKYLITLIKRFLKAIAVLFSRKGVAAGTADRAGAKPAGAEDTEQTNCAAEKTQTEEPK